MKKLEPRLEAIGREVTALLRDPIVSVYIRELQQQAARDASAAIETREETLRPPQGLDESPSTDDARQRTRFFVHRHCGVRSTLDEIKFEIYERTSWPLALHCGWCGCSVAISQFRFVEEHVLE